MPRSCGERFDIAFVIWLRRLKMVERVQRLVVVAACAVLETISEMSSLRALVSTQ